MPTVACVWLMLTVLLLPSQALAKEPPRIALVHPPTLVPQKKTLLTIRGFGLDQVTSIEFPRLKAPVSVTIRSKGKSGPPQKVDARKVGDTELKVEVTLPQETPSGALQIVVKGAVGTSKAHELLVVPKARLLVDKDPNDGFAKAQFLLLNKVVDGKIHRPQDVDVYRFRGKKGQPLSLLLEADKLGSALDGLLTLYDNKRELLATNDDRAAGRDPGIRITLPWEGDYFLVVKDANDAGSGLHFYRLLIREGGKD